MNTFSRALVRLTVAACALTILAISATSAYAASATVKLRVEAPGATLFNGTVTTTAPRQIAGEDLPGNTIWCDAGNNNSVTVNNPSGNSAVADVFNPTDYGTSGDRYGFGISICRVGAFTTTATDGWFWKINNRNSTLPQGYASGDSELVNGDEAVLYFDVAADNNTATLDLKLPASSQPNVPVHGVVDRWANSDDAKSDASGVVVSGGGATATSDANGQVTLSFPQAGRFLLSATKAGSVRGSEWITIDEAAAVAPSPIVRINRFVKCNGKYRKGTRKHRRCIRIVRAKQAAEHKAKSKN